MTKLTTTTGSLKRLTLFVSTAVWLVASGLLLLTAVQSFTDWLNNAATDPINEASAKIKMAALCIINVALLLDLRPNVES